ncbi:MAG: DUF1727 domain-containing protein [Firmicutes bacterium]|nr:DUF1727 domain-containing protein [Bacillota bacterium]
MPGKIARALDPGVLRRLAAQCPGGIFLVTGTNGKTTTARMLTSMLRRTGRKVVHNRSGANLLGGLTAAFLEYAGWNGRIAADMAVLEVDEATVPRAVLELAPMGAVVTNFFRDQLDRYGELDRTIALVKEGLQGLRDNRLTLLCSDDPLSAGLGEELSGAGASLIYYGLEPGAARDWCVRDQSDHEWAVCPTLAAAREAESLPVANDSESLPIAQDSEPLPTVGIPTAREACFCRACGSPLTYRRRFYSHLGHYLCPGCGMIRPEPDVAADLVSGTALLAFRAGEKSWTARLPVPGLYNVYNALAASAAAWALHIPTDVVAGAIESYAAGFGRMEELTVNGRRLLLSLVKNPVGFDEVLRTVLEEGTGAAAGTGAGVTGAAAGTGAVLGAGATMVIAINDLLADGTDISWLWDVDFERMAVPGAVSSVICSGRRAHDLAVRLKYAGVEPYRFTVETDLMGAVTSGLRLLPEGDGDTLYVLTTYTALLELRADLTNPSRARRFWEV